jgi:hypothetical protein
MKSSSMLFLDEKDIGNHSTLRHFALVLSLWILAPNVQKRNLGDNVPIFVHHGDDVWTYEGDYYASILFGISPTFWKTPHMRSVCFFI